MHTQVEAAQRVAEELLALTGVPHEGASQQAAMLIAAEARGLRSHGLLRLPRLIARLRNGMASPTSVGVPNWTSKSYLAVDGHRGLGPVVALRALALALPVAKEQGIVCVAITNSNHVGMLGWYTEYVASRGLACIGTTTSEALVHPWNGTEAIVGTNPVSIAVPAEPRPLVLDMATSEVSMGRIHEYAMNGHPLEPGWALDHDGYATLDAKKAMRGAIAPFGGPKGYALGIALGALVSYVTGSCYGTAVTGTLDETNMCNKGDVFVLLHGAGRPISEYLEQVRTSRPADPAVPVTVPGDRSHMRECASRHNGIDIPDDLWNELLILRRELQNMVVSTGERGQQRDR